MLLFMLKMEDASSIEYPLPKNITEPFFNAANECSLERSLEILIERSKSPTGRFDLAAINFLPSVLDLIQCLPHSSVRILLSSLKLLRNLCAGEIRHQDLFVERKGVDIVFNVIQSDGYKSDSGNSIIRMALQVLANVSLAGGKHQQAIWHHLYPNGFLALARVHLREILDPLCMIIYNSCIGHPELIPELCGDSGLPLVREIVQTAAAVGFGEDLLKLLLSRICLEGPYFFQLFSSLCLVSGNGEETEYHEASPFSSEQAYLLRIVSEILNERLREITLPNNFALHIFEIFKSSVVFISSAPGGKYTLPTEIAAIDVMGFSLVILRDICSQDSAEWSSKGLMDSVEVLSSSGLLDLLLSLLHSLEPPSIIRKSIKQDEDEEGTSSWSSMACPYKGFRRDIVAALGNCAYRRKHVQDEIREKKGILVLLQQCVTDDYNPFLREWGIWSMRNLLEDNIENQRVVAELELQESVNVPEISSLGLRVDIDQKTRRPKLVNVG